MNQDNKEIRAGEVSHSGKNVPDTTEKLPYAEPELVVYGKVTKLTLQTGVIN